MAIHTNLNITDIQEKGSVLLDPIQKLSDLVQENIAELGYTFNSQLSMLLTIFLALGLIWVGTKIANKFAKLGLFIVGILLVIGVGLSFFS